MQLGILRKSRTENEKDKNTDFAGIQIENEKSENVELENAELDNIELENAELDNIELENVESKAERLENTEIDSEKSLENRVKEEQLATENNDIVTRINDRFAKMSKSHKMIATFISDHYEQAVFMTAAKMGETLGISESTVVRFASGIGYEGYPEFQKALEEWVQNKLNTVQKIGVKYGNSTQSEILTDVLTADMEKISDTMQNLDPVAFETAVDIILNAKNIYIVGIRSCEPLADFMSFYLNMIRGNVQLLRTTSVSEMFEQMIRIDENDAIIGISFPRYSMRTLKAMEFANDRNAKVITITDSVHSPMNLYSSCNLLARSDMVSIVDSLVAPLSVINALVVALCLKRPQEVKNNLETLEEVWNNYQVYLNDEINFIDEEAMLNYPLKKEKDHE